MSERRTGVVVIGATGRLGRFACELLQESSDFELVARLDSSSDVPVVLRETSAPLGLDVTRAGLGLEHGLALLEAGLRPVIGTSGVSPEDTARLDARARELELGGLVVPNFSLGMVLATEFAQRAASWFEAAEIVETHHAAKADAPSGTALHVARLVAEARRERSPRPGGGEARGLDVDGVSVHALRLPSAPARQDVVFAAEGERLTISHEATAVTAYGPGLLIALAHAATALGVEHGLGKVLLER